MKVTRFRIRAQLKRPQSNDIGSIGRNICILYCRYSRIELERADGIDLKYVLVIERRL